MDLNNWRQIEDLFHAALPLKPEERASYLAEACSGDEVLRRDVESLVMAFEHSFMEEPVLSLGIKVLTGEGAESLVGKSLGQYKILRSLGSGGMGEVYLAEDCRLERPVALKFLKDKFIDNERAKEELTKEARAVARFEHSNICAVYGIEEVDGYNFIVMQFIEGETLASLLSHGPLGLRQVLGFAEQIASALSDAHRRGIIHRDIKPQNIVVTDGGQIKVLDFGLAKSINQTLESTDGNSTPVAQSEAIVGTIAYMSPEQLRAEELDYRSDIFSFGTVLFEMIGGGNPFKRASLEETISAIKEEAPATFERLSAPLPDGLKRLAAKCLEKDRTRRYATAQELLLDLQALRQDYEQSLSHPWKRRLLRQRAYARYYYTALVALTILFIAVAALFYYKVTRVYRVAVLPFESQSAEAEYVSEGLSKSIMDKLSGISRLHVSTPSTVSTYKGQKIDPVEVGRTLNVEAILLGTVARQGEVMQIQLRLLSTGDGGQLWGGTFNIKMAQILLARDEITRAVISNLGVWVPEGEEKLLTRHETENQEALRSYMQGQFYWNRRNEENLKIAIKYYEQATEHDPAFAQAWAGLADSYIFLPTPAYGSARTEEVIAKARYAAQQALKLDSMLCEAHTSLGVIKFKYDWDWQEAEKEFRQAIELNPDYAPAHYWYSNLLMVLRRNEEAIRESEINRRLEPFSTGSAINMGRAYYYARQYDRAAIYYNEVLAQKPGESNALYMLALVYLQKGMYAKVIEILQPLYATRPVYAAALLGYAYAKAGERDMAQGVIEKLDEISKTENVPAQEKAIIYMGLNEKEKAFDYLDEAYRERFSALISLPTDPLFDELHSHPRFTDFARRLNLAS